MSISVLNSSTVTKFVDDKDTFNRFVEECLVTVDQNGDGVLSPQELRDGFHRLLPFGSESQPEREMDEGMLRAIFERFDEDRNGVLDLEEFRSLMTEIMYAVARGFGGSPIIVALEEDSLLMKAFQHELATHPSSLEKMNSSTVATTKGNEEKGNNKVKYGSQSSSPSPPSPPQRMGCFWCSAKKEWKKKSKEI